MVEHAMNQVFFGAASPMMPLTEPQAGPMPRMPAVRNSPASMRSRMTRKFGEFPRIGLARVARTATILVVYG